MRRLKTAIERSQKHRPLQAVPKRQKPIDEMRAEMDDDQKYDNVRAPDAEEFISVCAWSNTVRFEGERIAFATYLERRFGLLTTHSISPKALEQLNEEEEASAGGVVNDSKRLAAVRGTGLLDTPQMAGFDRITRLGAAVLNVPVTFISLVDDNRDFYLSHCGFDEPMASERQITGQTFCHFTIQGERPVIIPDTRADPRYASVPTVTSQGVAAYLGIPLTLTSGEVIGAFCAIDFAAHDWSDAQVLAARDLASLVLSEIELRQAAFEFQRQITAFELTGARS